MGEECSVVGCQCSVGYADVAGYTHAMLYSNGAMEDLNDLIAAGSGWTLVTAFAINDNGWITGRASFGSRGYAYLLKPVPEPSGLLLTLVGFAMLHRRRRRAPKKTLETVFRL